MTRVNARWSFLRPVAFDQVMACQVARQRAFLHAGHILGAASIASDGAA